MKMLNKKDLTELYEKYLRNECSEEELQVFIGEMAALNEEDSTLYQLFDKTWQEAAVDEGEPVVTENILPVQDKPQPGMILVKRGNRQLLQWVAAACLVLALGAGMFVWLGRRKAPLVAETATQIHLSPEYSKATLTLGDGTTIVLDHGRDTALGQQGNTQVLQTPEGLVYKAAEGEASSIVYNVLTTPRGGQYRLTLPDGSNAWLNASASIRFPAAFTGNTREVEVSGEVYFEIQKNPGQPFVVRAGPSRTAVLGTHFDIKAYADDPAVNVVLLEGSVRFSGGDAQQVLKPNQEAILNKQSGTVNVQVANIADAMAWTRGELSLSGKDIKELMQEISRWYDVDVEIKGALQPRQFQGALKRNVSLPDVLAALDANGVGTKLEGRKLIVSMK